MNSTSSLITENDKKKANSTSAQSLPEALDVSSGNHEPEQQTIVTAAQEINKTAADKKKGYKEGNKNDSDTANVEENK